MLFDFEAHVTDKKVGENQHGPIYEHEVCLAVAQKVSDQCKDNWDRDEKNCAVCGTHQVLFKGDDCLQEFGSWLFSEANRGGTIFAHNMKGQLVLV